MQSRVHVFVLTNKDIISIQQLSS